MEIFDRLFGKKEQKKVNNDKKKIKKQPRKSGIGRKNSKTQNKRELNQKVFNEFMNKNSHYFNSPVKDMIGDSDYGDKYISKGSSIELNYSNRHPNNIPPYTIGIHIRLNTINSYTGRENWEVYGPHNFIKGNKNNRGDLFEISSTDNDLFKEIKKIKSIHTRIKNTPPEEEKKRMEEEKKRMEEEKKKLKQKVSLELKRLDKDNNGVVDIIQDDCFGELLQKHQSKIIKIDRKYIQDFVKISKFLKIKENNIQNSFKSLKKVKNISDFKKFINIISNQKHGYELLLFHSLSMITSLIKDDLITFYEIYEEFDSLEVFKSNHENLISKELKSLNLKSSIMIEQLEGVMYSINSFENSVVNSLSDLSYVTSSGFDSLSSSIGSELSSINSSIKFNNLLTGIQTYQMYKINKNTKSLRS